MAGDRDDFRNASSVDDGVEELEMERPKSGPRDDGDTQKTRMQ